MLTSGSDCNIVYFKGMKVLIPIYQIFLKRARHSSLNHNNGVALQNKKEYGVWNYLVTGVTVMHLSVRYTLQLFFQLASDKMMACTKCLSPLFTCIFWLKIIYMYYLFPLVNGWIFLIERGVSCSFLFCNATPFLWFIFTSNLSHMFICIISSTNTSEKKCWINQWIVVLLYWASSMKTFAMLLLFICRNVCQVLQNP
jgi:hypothetical protein